jgi:hypothetical protein
MSFTILISILVSTGEAVFENDMNCNTLLIYYCTRFIRSVDKTLPDAFILEMEASKHNIL